MPGTAAAEVLQEALSGFRANRCESGHVPEAGHAPARKDLFCTCAHGKQGAALGMGDPESEPEQIRLKCIRKEGFFTVPPEHRVRQGPLAVAPPGGRAGPKRPGAP